MEYRRAATKTKREKMSNDMLQSLLVVVVPLHGHDVKTLESFSIKQACTSKVFSLMLVSTLGFDSMDGS